MAMSTREADLVVVALRIAGVQQVKTQETSLGEIEVVVSPAPQSFLGGKRLGSAGEASLYLAGWLASGKTPSQIIIKNDVAPPVEVTPDELIPSGATTKRKPYNARQTTECPVCGKACKSLALHMRAMHPEEALANA